MPRISSLAREEAFEKLRNGATAEEVADEYGVSTSSARKWQAEATGEPGSVTPPSVKMVGATKTRRGKHAVKPISDETAGMMCAALFSIAALVDQEPCWYLTDIERKALAEPLAESLRLLPSPVADAVNTYTAPGVLVTVAATIVNNKLKYRAAKRSGKLRAVPSPMPSPMPSATTQNYTSPPSSQETTIAADLEAESPMPAATPQASRVDPAILDALNAARGGLAAGEDSDAEGLLFTGS